MRNTLLTISFLLLLTQCHIHHKFNTSKNEIMGYDIPVQGYFPKGFGEKNEKFPLILWLHGAGERGNDNVNQIKHVYPFLISNSVQDSFPCVVIAPQCPKDDYWAPVKRFEWTWQNRGKVTNSMKEVIHIIEDLLKDDRIDKNRIYVVGFSMGGFGTLDLLSRRPEWFAGAIDISGGADLTKVPRYAHIPLWVFHGQKDDVVPITLSEQLITAIRKEHGSPRYTVYAEGNHVIWDSVITEKGLMSWLFSQKRR
ncbi:MAG: prolyl oligopeptidase family serine peptidase [Saprospiraceae bacterium]